MAAFKTKIGEGGRVVLPSAARKAAGLNVGDEVFVMVEKDKLTINSIPFALRKAQNRMAKYLPRNRSVAKELIDERRREARKE